MLPELGSLLGMSHAHPRSALPTPLGVGITAHFTHQETEAERNEPRASQGLWGWTQDCRGRSLSRVPLLVPLPNASSAPALRQALHGQSSKHSSTPAPVSRGCCNKQPHPWWLDRNPSHSSAVPELEIEVSGRLCSLWGAGGTPGRNPFFVSSSFWWPWLFLGLRPHCSGHCLPGHVVLSSYRLCLNSPCFSRIRTSVRGLRAINPG